MATVPLAEQRPPINGFDREWVREDNPLTRDLVFLMDNRVTGGNKVFDASGRGNHATWLTVVDHWVARNRGSVLYLDGTDDYAQIPLRYQANTPVTIAAWVRLSSDGNYPMIVSTTPNIPPYSGFDLRLYQGTRQPAFVYDQDEARSSTALSTGVWYYLCGVWDGTELHIYVDGKLKASSGVDSLTSTVTASYDYFIGRRPSTDNYHFPGNIDGLAIWHADMRYAIADLYHSQLPGGPGILAESTRRLWVPVGGGSPPAETYSKHILCPF